MKEYTVKDIAELLKINPETVRRWIRNGELEASQISRKSGNVVSEQSLTAFLKKMPQYAPLAAGVLLPSPLSLGMIVGSLFTSVIAASHLKKNSKVSPDDVKNHLKKEILKSKKKVEKQERDLKKLQEEYEKEKRRMNEFEYALVNLDFDKLAKKINDEMKED